MIVSFVLVLFLFLRWLFYRVSVLAAGVLVAIGGQLILLLIVMVVVVIFRIDSARAFKLTLRVVVIARIFGPVRVLIIIF